MLYVRPAKSYKTHLRYSRSSVPNAPLSFPFAGARLSSAPAASWVFGGALGSPSAAMDWKPVMSVLQTGVSEHAVCEEFTHTGTQMVGADVNQTSLLQLVGSGVGRASHSYSPASPIEKTKHTLAAAHLGVSLLNPAKTVLLTLAWVTATRCLWSPPFSLRAAANAPHLVGHGVEGKSKAGCKWTHMHARSPFKETAR